ncbi:hypothetical protein NDU88_005546 [Pleurodeles waltl]|uniref:Uncharacterized protein n=1 Tax=Pleurodeles waltl TaxID=8319 RepID=A0AAV7MYE5_PLEWA|nr:hypothetical protein NDU88_005546 [Pleurodeles waltl]
MRKQRYVRFSSWVEATVRRYGEGERTGKMLAGMLRRPWAGNYVVELQDSADARWTGAGWACDDRVLRFPLFRLGLGGLFRLF